MFAHVAHNHIVEVGREKVQIGINKKKHWNNFKISNKNKLLPNFNRIDTNWLQIWYLKTLKEINYL
jgi:hypothetical protein